LTQFAECRSMRIKHPANRNTKAGHTISAYYPANRNSTSNPRITFANKNCLAGCVPGAPPPRPSDEGRKPAGLFIETCSEQPECRCGAGADSTAGRLSFCPPGTGGAPRQPITCHFVRANSISLRKFIFPSPDDCYILGSWSGMPLFSSQSFRFHD
jgi:hypothetical protein